MASGTLRLLIEGWRNIAHSYALINSFQLLEMLKRPEVKVYFRDTSFPTERWAQSSGVFPLPEENLLNELTIWGGEEIDAVYRIGYPADLGPPPKEGIPVYVFLTAEFQVFEERHFINGTQKDIMSRAYLHFITPSKWSAEAMKKLGWPHVVIAHGVDQTKFYRISNKEREEIRSRLGFRGKYIWLNIGAMTGNKGLDLLIQGFAEVSLRYPNGVLLLKGLKDLYNSREFVERWMKLVPENQRPDIRSKIIFTDDRLAFKELNSLYNIADCYVSPYRAEGFNLPILEAASAGLCSLVSKGGSTDDFVLEGFTKQVTTKRVIQGSKVFLQPRLDDLIHLMCEVQGDEAFRKKALKSGPRHVAAGYQWKHIVDILLETITKGVGLTAVDE